MRGASWAYNEPRSHSGFNVVRAYLPNSGQRDRFLWQRRRIRRPCQVDRNDSCRAPIDGAAIDSTVLEWLGSQRDGFARRDSRNRHHRPESDSALGDFDEIVRPILRCQVRQLLLELHLMPRGRAVLGAGAVGAIYFAEDRDYDPIRRMARKAERVLLA